MATTSLLDFSSATSFLFWRSWWAALSPDASPIFHPSLLHKLLLLHRLTLHYILIRPWWYKEPSIGLCQLIKQCYNVSKPSPHTEFRSSKLRNIRLEEGNLDRPRELSVLTKVTRISVLLDVSRLQRFTKGWRGLDLGKAWPPCGQQRLVKLPSQNSEMKF